MHSWSVNLQQWRQEYTMEKKKLFIKWCWENLRATSKRMKLEHSNTMQKNYLKMDYRPKCKTEYYKTSRGKHTQNSL